ncbi:hypothetical protein ACGFX2_17390 [Streptomyces goshikiensis]|uniref:hypothetical protein n=1 Tax=Streptomyces goshikiensis TaxID=1942 RepID=UPI00371A70D8
MAVKTLWSIDHDCGHTTQADLSDRPADRRAGYARWLAGRNCTDCWQSGRGEDAASRSEWLERKRSAEQARADEWAEQYRMPPLEGTGRALVWGSRCRHQLVTAAYTALVVEGGMSDTAWEEFEGSLRPLTRAGWWIDQRDADPEDLPELVEAATSDDRPTENPFF